MITAEGENVSRGDVYSAYAEICAAYHVILLNPASFGKVIRIVHPGLETRRLGIRGDSKYKYVDIALRQPPAPTTAAPPTALEASQS